MPHIHTEPGQYDHTASAYIFRVDFSEPKIMLHRHKLLNRYMQFGGHIELNETPWQAIIHELREETGYDIQQLSLLQPERRMKHLTNAVTHPAPIAHSSHPFGSNGSGHFHTDIAYALIAHEAPKYTPHDGESTDIKLFTRREIAELPGDKIIENIREIALAIFDDFLETWQPVSPREFK